MSPATWHRDGESYITCSPQPCAQAHQHYIFKWEPVSGFQATDDAADFASLLEREPLVEPWSPAEAAVNDAAFLGEQVLGLRKDLDNAMTMASQELSRAEKAARERDLAKKTAESQALYIKSLEDVLVAIRAKAASVVTGAQSFKTCQEISSLVSETLDPCKPWCVVARDGEVHPGPCVSDEEIDRDE